MKEGSVFCCVVGGKFNFFASAFFGVGGYTSSDVGLCGCLLNVEFCIKVWGFGYGVFSCLLFFYFVGEVLVRSFVGFTKEVCY